MAHRYHIKHGISFQQKFMNMIIPWSYYDSYYLFIKRIYISNVNGLHVIVNLWDRYPIDQWCILVFERADVMWWCCGEGAGGVPKCRHAREKFSNAGFKRMFWNHVFCPIVLYTNPSWAGCVSPHLRRATFLPFDIKTIAKMRRKPQHVGNVRADVPNMLRFSSHICNGFYIKWQKCDAT